MNDPSWLDELRRRAAQPPLRPREPLRLGKAEIGSIEPGVGQRMADAGLPLRPEDGAWQITSHDDDTLADLAQWLHEQGLASRWRGELLPVTDAQGRAHGAIERAAVRPLGITTHAVHLVGRHADGRYWVQQRAFDKATDPGMWDTLVGGLMAAGESVMTTLERETWEEAGLRLAELDGLQPLGHLQIRRPVDEGYMVERATLFQAVLPRRLQPANQDGEVAGFACVDAARLDADLAAGRYTLEAALIHAHARELDTSR
ncbi:NUDIX domain-containing protein [Variovorax sp. YR752]|uniref:NUDIX domain-containing protein n=1 Tax=Variovorax sp. YR752 TaxID=1884383 RepID=UPI003137E6AE